MQCVSPVASGFILRKQFTRTIGDFDWYITAKFHYYACFKTSQSPSDCSITLATPAHQLEEREWKKLVSALFTGALLSDGKGACCEWLVVAP